MTKDTNDKENGTSKPGPGTPLIAVTTKGLGKYRVDRDVQTQEQIQIAAGYDPPKRKLFQWSRARGSPRDRCWKVLRSVFPILEWLSEYSIKRDLFGDLIAGLTTAIMHVPQGMAYAMLASVIPTAGLYMAFFPALVYVLLGTSRHVSMGTFAVVSIMVGKIVQEHGYFPETSVEDRSALAPESSISPEPDIKYEPIEVATAVTFLSGVYLLIMCLFRLGALSSLLCEPLVNGFTTAAAVAVLVSQMKDLLGLHIKRHNGMFCLGYNIYETIMGIPTANTTTIIVSGTVVLVMTLNNELIKPWVKKYCKMPIPAELMCAIGGTVVSFYMDLKVVYDVNTVGTIPTGLPIPQYPRFSLMRLVAVDTIAVSIVSYSIVMSMALIFAKKHQYTIRPNQELLAMGVGNLVGAGFSCIPVACSLTRSLIQSDIGGKTQMATVVSASLILVVLLWIAPFLGYLPRGVLAAIIVVALKGMFMQVKDLKRFWLMGRMHAAIWVATFLGVVVISIDIGLFIGVALSLVMLLFGNTAKCTLMGNIPGTDLYVDMNFYKLAEEIPKIKIIQYSGNISFASAGSFKKSIFKHLELDVKQANVEGGEQDTKSVRILILDMSSVRNADSEGICSFFSIRNELAHNNINLLMAAQNDGVLHVIRRLEKYGSKSCAALLNSSQPVEAFPTVHDAVTHAKIILGPNN